MQAKTMRLKLLPNRCR